MWWSRRSAVAAAVALALAACGFAPAYGPGGPATALQGRVAVQAPGTSPAYVLVARLEERLGRPGSAPAYDLTYTLSTRQESVAITPAAEITRYNVTGTLDWRLVATAGGTAGGTVAASGQTTAFTSYSATGSTIATRAAREDATDRLMTILADRTVDEIILKTAGRGP